MALYAIGDLHLCLGAPKPMDIFGGAWTGYMEKLKTGMSVIGPEDTTVLLGDLSWALDLQSAQPDLRGSMRFQAERSFSRETTITGGAPPQNFINSAKRTVSPICRF